MSLEMWEKSGPVGGTKSPVGRKIKSSQINSRHNKAVFNSLVKEQKKPLVFIYIT
jgi:hypothetical protein